MADDEKNETKKSVLEVSSSTLVDLKAELFRKKEEFNREKLDPSARASKLLAMRKSSSQWVAANKGVEERDKRDKLQTIPLSEDETTKMSKVSSVLARKADLYQKLLAGNLSEEESQLYLVDFDGKALLDLESSTTHNNKNNNNNNNRNVGSSSSYPPLESDEFLNIPLARPGDEWVDYVDSFGRERRCMKKDLASLVEMDKEFEAEKKKREDKIRKEEEEVEDKGPMHFQQALGSEVRTMGTGYYQFSDDQVERSSQLAALNQLRDETLAQREKSEKLKRRRQAMQEARLEKIKNRKLSKQSKSETTDPTSDQPTANGLGYHPEDEGPDTLLSSVDELLAFYKNSNESG